MPFESINWEYVGSASVISWVEPLSLSLVNHLALSPPMDFPCLWSKEIGLNNSKIYFIVSLDEKGIFFKTIATET